MYNMPSGFIEQKARELASRPGAGKSFSEWLEDLNAQYGMNKGPVMGYLTWLSNAVRGNWGESWAWTLPVTQEFHNTIWFSFALGLVTFILEIIIAVPLGITAAKKQYSFTDYFTTVVSMICISMPTFFVATVLKYIFSVKLGWVHAWSPTQQNLVLPVIALAMYPAAYITRLTKTSMLDVMGQDYVRTARAKGVAQWKVLFVHTLRNALIPVVTYLGPMIAGVLTGSLVVEQIFTIGGLGAEFVQSITNRDYPMIMGVTIFLAVFMVTMNLLTDIVYKLIDPRINLD
jgi:ABC-type dipeptide/oligopeptide/nickel transport system permease component